MLSVTPPTSGRRAAMRRPKRLAARCQRGWVSLLSGGVSMVAPVFGGGVSMVLRLSNPLRSMSTSSSRVRSSSGAPFDGGSGCGSGCVSDLRRETAGAASSISSCESMSLPPSTWLWPAGMPSISPSIAGAAASPGSVPVADTATWPATSGKGGPWGATSATPMSSSPERRRW